MIRPNAILSGYWLVWTILAATSIAGADEQGIPEVLKPWKAWVTWGDKGRSCPPAFDNVDTRICFWPSRLSLTIDQAQANWSIAVDVFGETWVPLPGSADSWPQNVTSNDKPIAVLDREGKPFARLNAGTHQISGSFQWRETPQRVTVPQEIGILALVVNGKAIDLPTWDADGNVWLKRQQAEVAEKDFLSPRVYRVIEDGTPIWLRTEIELTVSGKSREESLGWIVPAGWQLSFVESPLPVAIDPQGRVKAQVRAGRWTIAIDAFRTTDVQEFRYPPGAQPVTATELVGWKSQPLFRTAELVGIQAVDVTQTTFPEKWRELPVYEWKTNASFRIVEKLRGMGSLHPQGLSILRRFWLDDDGRGLTYRDSLSGKTQQIWRLDVAPGEELGAVRIDGQGQLVTVNPKTGAEGVEVRTHNLNMEAIGRTEHTADMSATGWNTAADSLQLSIILPPGWRVLALFGADSVRGDWLTAWTLLDTFLVLVFAFAVLRLWGFRAGLIALLAFGLSYHERGAPRYTWLLLLLPLALSRVVPPGAASRFVTVWKFAAVLLLAICLVPFLAEQIQIGIYPQLESPGAPYSQRRFLPLVFPGVHDTIGQISRLSSSESSKEGYQAPNRQLAANAANLQFEATSKIQTGPAEPGWTWNQVDCAWNGPVDANQRIRPILISLFWHRILIVVRVALLLALVAVLLSPRGGRRFGLRGFLGLFRKQAVAAAGLATALLLAAGAANAQQADKPFEQIPSQQLLDALRERLLAPSDAFPRAAEVAASRLTLRGSQITIESEIHAALRVAVPLPGRLATWSPLSVKIDDKTTGIAVSRRDGYLWAVVPEGVHKVVVEGLAPAADEWEWTFLLKPRQVSIDAADWSVTGVGPNGVPEQQVFFAKKQKVAASEAAYDRKDFQAVVAVQRQIEAGLVWRAHNSVTRLSSPGKAISLKVPLLPGENVLTANVSETGGEIELRLAAGETSLEWESELPITPTIHLTARNNSQWVERWQLIASPVWNVTIEGLPPVFEPQETNLVPVWRPWPGEEVTLAFNRPQEVSGDTVTVQSVDHEISLGERQRTNHLKLDLECSLGSDFAIDIAPDAEITSLTLDGTALPVRREGKKLIVSAHPGRQTVEAVWRTADAMTIVTKADPVSLPVETANITTVMSAPESRWVLWADGPQRGPAIRFWVVLAVAVLAALAAGGATLSPLNRLEWVLLAIGLTQVHVVAAIVVVGWLFVLAWRGTQTPQTISAVWIGQVQLAIVLLTIASLVILFVVASKGLLGEPEMFIVGNGSTQTRLQWFQPRAGLELSEPSIVSVSVWYFRFAMLAWALWLAVALLRWLVWGWKQFSHGGVWISSKSREQLVHPEVVS